MGTVSRRGFIGSVLAGAATTAVTGEALPAAAAESDHFGGSARARLDNRMRTHRQWADFLARQDLHWERLPVKWYDAPFLGNGLLGTLVYAEPGRNAVRFTVQHSQVQDHRPQFSDPNFGIARLPVGHFTLEPVGRITGIDLRLDLWNAELRGSITTSAGQLGVRAFVHTDHAVLVVAITPSGRERAYKWVFHPAQSISPKALQRPNPPDYTGNPPPELSRDGDIAVVTQPMLAGGQYVTAYRETRRVLYTHVAYSFPEPTARPRAVTAVRRASGHSVEALARTHRRWWNDFYPKSFLSVPDEKLQSFYWIQLYKLASATRENAPVMSTCGPWLEPTPWPAHWWNLNAQLEYWPIYGANHIELDALTATVARNRPQLVDNTPEPYRADSLTLPRVTNTELFSGSTVGIPGRGTNAELGNLTWALHNVWLTYRHTMNDRLLRDTLFPLLRGAINYYLHFLAPGPDGKLHLPETVSPEYGSAPDCNYDLALIRWGCQTLLDACDRLKMTDPLQPKWRDVLAMLVDYPVDDKGFMVGAGVPFAKSHRHYSHLLMVYPLYLVNGEQPANRDLIDRSLKHWISFEGALQGYSFTGAASISAAMGRGNDALHYLGELVRRFVKAATMYKESGPVIETPLSGAQTMHEMLCQSWGGMIRIFPAVPDAWADVTLHDFRTEGAFLVSAVRKAGVTQFVRVRSLVGEACRMRTSIAGPVEVHRLCVDQSGPQDYAVRPESHAGRVNWRYVGEDIIEIELPAGDEVVIHAKGARPQLTIAAVPVSQPAEPWGLRQLPPRGEMVPLELTAAYDNDGISRDENPADGDVDGSGYTYSTVDVPSAGPLVSEEVPFVFPSGADGAKNNLTGRGQTIAVPAGRYANLWMLGSATGGNLQVDAIATYADATTAPVRIRLSEWIRETSFGETELVRCTKRNHPAGRNNANPAIFQQVAALDATRELRSITLPTLTRPQLHLFALTLERPVRS